MLEIKVTGDNSKRHQCIGAREGDWVIFKCTQCDYIRKINLKTGKSKTLNSSFELLHQGSFSELEEPMTPPQSLN